MRMRPRSTRKTQIGKVKYIGLFSITSRKDSDFFDALVFNQDRKLQGDFRQYSYPQGKFVTIDVCDSLLVLSHIVAKILFDTTFSEIAFIVSYMHYDMTKLKASLLSGTNIYLRACQWRSEMFRTFRSM